MNTVCPVMFRRPTRLAAVTGLCVLLASPALAQGLKPDPKAGREAAQRWCVQCHVIEGEAVSGVDAGPTFRSLAQDPAKTASSLRAFLSEPHAPMPPLVLSSRDIDNLVAFIESLALAE